MLYMEQKDKSLRITLKELGKRWVTDCSLRSTCKRLQVGAIIFTHDLRRVLSYGYNGNYAGGKNKCDSIEEGACGCVHAEINALISCRNEPDMVMFTTDSPCLNCAKCILNAGVKKVYYIRDYRNKEGIKLLKSKIEVEKI